MKKSALACAAMYLAILPGSVEAQTRDDIINDAIYSYALFGCSALAVIDERPDLSDWAIEFGIKLGRTAIAGIEQGKLELMEQALLLPMAFHIHSKWSVDFQLGIIASEAWESALTDREAPGGTIRVWAGINSIEIECSELWEIRD